MAEWWRSTADHRSSEVVNYLAPSVRNIPCAQLVRTGPDLAHCLGYGSGGISKGSYAAVGMSLEARACGGGVPPMSQGGVSASLQSIGATGVIKPQAMSSLSAAMERSCLKLKPTSETRIRFLR